MNKTLKIILLVLLFAIIGGILGYYWINFKQDKYTQLEIKKQPTQPIIDNGIEMTFNQTEYANNGATSDEVILTIKNTTKDTYFLYSPVCAAGTPYVESTPPENTTLLNNTRIAVSPTCNMIPSLDELRPNDSYSFEWNQVDYAKEGEEKFVDSGYYHMILQLFKEKEDNGNYSRGENEFQIVSPTFRIVYQSPKERIDISSPSKKDILKSGDTYTINWKNAKSDKVNLYYGVEWRMNLNPEQKQVIELDIPNTGSYDWQVPNLFDVSSYGEDYIIKIEEVDSNGIGYSQMFKFKAIAKTEIITRIVTLEDSLRTKQIDKECLEQRDRYMASKDYSNKGFSDCTIIDKTIGVGKDECIYNSSPQGCYICKLECR